MTPSKAFLSIAILASLAPNAVAWVSRLPSISRPSTFLRSSQGLPSDDVDSPCWQDIWNYDCAMSNIYSAHFVASDWINSMPCASGLADCDTPEELRLPGNAAGSGVENVDVMEFLKLKRAVPLMKE